VHKGSSIQNQEPEIIDGVKKDIEGFERILGTSSD